METVHDKINGVVRLAARSTALATDLIQATPHPPTILSQVLIECSSLRATFESLGILNVCGKTPARIRSLLDGGDSDVIGNCTKALEDLGDLLEPLVGVIENRDTGHCGDLQYIHNLLKSVTALRVAASTSAGDQSKWYCH
jgi:hypothetical protein